MASAFVEEADHVLGILDHLLELFRGILFFAGEVKELAIVSFCLLVVLEKISIGIGDVIIGSYG